MITYPPSKHSSWSRRLQDALKTSFVFVFRRRLNQNEYVRLSLTSSRRLQDLLVKTNIFVLAIRLQDVFKTSSRRLQDIFETSCQDVFKTSWKTSSRHLQDVLQRDLQDVFKTHHQVKLFLLTCLREAFFFIVTFTLHSNVKKLQSLGNLNWYITWENKKWVKNLI